MPEEEGREKLLAAAIQERGPRRRRWRRPGPALRKPTAAPNGSVLETATSKTEIYQGSLKILFLEEALWQDRFRLAQDEDAAALREKRAEAEKALTQIGSLEGILREHRLDRTSP